MPLNRIRPLPYIIRGSVTQQKQQNKSGLMRWLHRHILSQGWPSHGGRITHEGPISANPGYTRGGHMNLNKYHLFQHFKKGGSKPYKYHYHAQHLINTFYTFKHPGQKDDKPGKPRDINITEHCICVSYYRCVMGKVTPHSSHSIALPIHMLKIPTLPLL